MPSANSSDRLRLGARTIFTLVIVFFIASIPLQQSYLRPRQRLWRSRQYQHVLRL